MKKDPKLQVTQQLSTSPYNIQLNTNAPPFNNPKARQAIYYATDSEAIRSKLFQNRYPSTQGFTAPGGLFFSADVPGYRTYDLEKAKALVKELGGLKTQLGTINVLVAKQTTQALASQWAQAGIKADIKSYDLGPLIQAFQSKKWTPCSRRPAPTTRPRAWASPSGYASQSPFSGVHDKKLDAMLGQAAGTLDQRPAQVALRPGRQVHERRGLQPVPVRRSLRRASPRRA
jgi:peptide/nickel transport system substrate-binding protein